MIRGSLAIKLAALAVAAGAHVALAVVLLPDETTRIEGATGGATVRLGNGFADMVQGVTQPQAAQAVASPIPAKPALALRAAKPDPVQQSASSTASAVSPVPSTIVPTAPRAPGAAPSPFEPLVAQTTSEPAPAVPGLTALPATPAPASARQAPASAPPVPPEPGRTDTALQVLEGSAPATGAVTRSLRPNPRSAAFEQTHKPDPAPRAQAKPPKTNPAPKPSSTGNAAQTTRAGTATGQTTAKARSSGSGGKTKASGNAAASNYRGVVARCIARAGRPGVRGGGTARVSFRITDSGRITAVVLSRPSGNPALDRAAMSMIRRAGPCPAPPPGADRAHAVNIQSR
ncbi:TonB family protein [Primorskyibacter sp. 2E107]|uniref:TonB family protein n=1 Tax=Primorskyibacter sp. 2E107 TaxID=3403458 RepID=UPI003AF91E40